MRKQTEILEAVKTCIAIEESCGDFDGNRLALNILEVEGELGVVIKVDSELPEGLDVWKEIPVGVYFIGADALEKAGYVAVESLTGDK